MTEPTAYRILRIQDLPSSDRPRERLLRLGPSALGSDELLALLLGCGTRGESALDQARRMLAAHGRLLGLAGAAAMSSLPTAASEARVPRDRRGAGIARRLAAEPLAGEPLQRAGPREGYRACTRRREQEKTGALYLNARNRLLRDDSEIYRGPDRAVSSPRDPERALLASAAGIIVYHNHFRRPSLRAKTASSPSPGLGGRRRRPAPRSRRRGTRGLRVLPRGGLL